MCQRRSLHKKRRGNLLADCHCFCYESGLGQALGCGDKDGETLGLVIGIFVEDSESLGEGDSQSLIRYIASKHLELCLGGPQVDSSA